MKRLALLVALAGCASSAADGPRAAWAPGPQDRSDAAVDDAGITAREIAWLVAHLGDDADTSNTRENESVRRLSAMGDEALRATAEVFRVGDERRMPFARRVFERALARRCRRDEARVTRTLRALQGLDASPDAGEVERWVRRGERWSTEGMARVRAWIDAGATCAE